MELTPINVPGKRRRAGQPTPPRISRRRQKPRDKVVKKPLEALPRTPSLVKKKTSYLEERLPFEVLREIFMYSENVNFVRASLRIGHFLSDIQTRREAFICAFAPQWLIQPYDTPIPGNWISYGGNPDFQSALLEYSWVNVRFIAECFEQCTRKAPQPMKGRDIFGGLVPDDEELSGGAGSNGEVTAEKPEDYFMAHFNTFATTAQDFSRMKLVRPSVNQMNMVHPETLIPEALVVGPWDEESIKKLFWLIRSGARLGSNHTWEDTSRGFDAALENFDGNGIWALMMLSYVTSTRIWMEWPMHVLKEAAESTKKLWQRIITLNGGKDEVERYFPFQLLSSIRADIRMELASRSPRLGTYPLS